MRDELKTLEQQIYKLETNYLEKDREVGNVFTGWKHFLSSEKTKPKKNITNDERLFSLSSISSPASRHVDYLQAKLEGGGGGGGDKKKKRKAGEGDA